MDEQSSGKVKLQRIIRFIAFAAVFCIIFLLLSNVFRIPETQMTRRFNTFYTEEEDTIDAIYLGSSAVDRYFATPLAWNNYGITVYPLSSNVQPIVAAKFLMEEALKTQSPKVFIVEVRGCKKETESSTEGIYRVLTDQMEFSYTRIKLINALLDFNDISPLERFRYYFSLTKYHDLWEEGITEENFTRTYSSYKGFYISNATTALTTPFEEPTFTDVREPLEEGVEEALRDLIDYCEANDLKVLFVSSPYVMKDIERKRLNTISDIFAECGSDFINFNDEERELQEFRYDHDLYNEWHTNIYGAEQYTAFLSEYLIQNYGLQDKRELPGDAYDSWDVAYKTYKTKINKLKKAAKK